MADVRWAWWGLEMALVLGAAALGFGFWLLGALLFGWL